jgi:hypothetical protein
MAVKENPSITAEISQILEAIDIFIGFQVKVFAALARR